MISFSNIISKMPRRLVQQSDNQPNLKMIYAIKTKCTHAQNTIIYTYSLLLFTFEIVGISMHKLQRITHRHKYFRDEKLNYKIQILVEPSFLSLATLQGVQERRHIGVMYECVRSIGGFMRKEKQINNHYAQSIGS